MNRSLLCLVALVGSLAGAQATATASYLERDDVKQWISETASSTGLDARKIEKVLAQAKPQQKVLDRISAPAEKTLTWADYRPIFIQPERIKAGQRFLREHASLLHDAELAYGVPAEIIAAIIGVETFYGRYKGRDPALSSLVTLAFDYPPRAKFFRRELAEFLLLAEEEVFDPLSINGSYAAAMGMPQFISSSYRAYAVDFDRDGRRDLWDSTADVVGSVANYLKRHGWVSGEPIAEEVKPNGDAYRQMLGKKLKPAWKRAELRARGVQTRSQSKKKKSVMEFQAKDGPQVWVGFQNFYAITRYNHSKLYALAVYELSKEIANSN